MNDDLEARLRRTYRAVAEKTDASPVEQRDDFVRAAEPPSSSRRWVGPALVAAVAFLVVGGLAVVDRPGAQTPADASKRTHALATWLPMPFGRPGSSDGGRPPLVSIASDANVDVTEYASNELSVVIRVDRIGLDDLDGGRVEVRGGQVATFEGGEDAGSLRWNTSGGPTVAIEWVGPVFGGIDSIIDVVDGLILVDDETWEAATEFGGFTDDREMLRRAVGPTEVFVQGDIQSGMVLGVGNTHGLDPSPCAMVHLGDPETWAVVSRFSSGTATFTWSDGTVARADLSPFVPGSALGVALAERPRFESGELPDVVCEAAS